MTDATKDGYIAAVCENVSMLALSYNEYWGCDGMCKECPAKIGNRIPRTHYNVWTCEAAKKMDVASKLERLMLERGAFAAMVQPERSKR